MAPIGTSNLDDLGLSASFAMTLRQNALESFPYTINKMTTFSAVPMPATAVLRLGRLGPLVDGETPSYSSVWMDSWAASYVSLVQPKHVKISVDSTTKS